MEIIHDLGHWMQHWAGTPYAPIALFVFAFWESSFFPIPPDPLLIAMAIIRPELALIYAAVATVASVVGAAFGYWIGQHGGRPIVERLFSEKKISAAQELYQRYDVWAVGAAAFSPIPFKVFTITAGVAELNFPRFMAACILGRGGRFFAVGTLIFLFGDSIEHAINNYFEYFTVALVILFILGILAVKYGSSYLARRHAAEEALEVTATD